MTNLVRLKMKESKVFLKKKFKEQTFTLEQFRESGNKIREMFKKQQPKAKIKKQGRFHQIYQNSLRN